MQIIMYKVAAAVICLGAILIFYNLQSDLQCIERNVIVSRGKHWVDKKVPYNTSQYIDFYREDSGGFISMCWQLNKTLTTATLTKVAVNITKSDLLPGDAMLCHQGFDDNQTHHVALFVGWTNSSKTHYHGYELSPIELKTVSHVFAYPFNYSAECFYPIRYQDIC